LRHAREVGDTKGKEKIDQQTMASLSIKAKFHYASWFGDGSKLI